MHAITPINANTTGPMYYNGIYHLFYQYNPKGAVWGNIVWGHAVSKDLINWKELEPALYPSKPFDKYGVWSGSATVLPGKGPVILYTGVIDKQSNEVQLYAIPENKSDPFLRKWVKPKAFNPIVVADHSMNASVFRDPTTAWWSKDGHWRMLIGGRRKDRGMAYLYRSKDFVKWIQAKHPIHSAASTGMWECPDFYPVSLKGKNGLDISVVGSSSIKHVLKNSLDLTRYEYYTIGTYFKNKDKYIPDNTSEDGWGGLRYDYGNFYASKSFFDPSKNRRILWAWANESNFQENDVKKGWAGIQVLYVHGIKFIRFCFIYFDLIFILMIYYLLLLFNIITCMCTQLFFVYLFYVVYIKISVNSENSSLILVGDSCTTTKRAFYIADSMTAVDNLLRR